jgi:hypothetical protein
MKVKYKMVEMAIQQAQTRQIATRCEVVAQIFLFLKIFENRIIYR